MTEVIGYKADAPTSKSLGNAFGSAGDTQAYMQRLPAPTPTSGYHYEVTKLGFFIGLQNPTGESHRLALYAGDSRNRNLSAD